MAPGRRASFSAVISDVISVVCLQILQTVHSVRVLLFHIHGVLRAASRAAAVRAQAAADQLHIHVDHGGHHAAGLHDDDGQRVDDAGRDDVRRDDDRGGGGRRLSPDDRSRARSASIRGRRASRHRPVRRRQRHRGPRFDHGAVDLRRRRRHRELARQEFQFGPGQTQGHVESDQPHRQKQLDVQLQQGRCRNGIRCTVQRPIDHTRGGVQ